jgi:ABC-2 type transport system permease protein
MGDTFTVWRKELLEGVATPRIRRQGIIGIIALCLFVDIFAVTHGSFGDVGASPIGAFVIFPLVILPMFIAADSFAGERERHTLETLLASRLPDRAIVLGKLFAILSYSLAAVILIEAQALIVMAVTGASLGALVATMGLISAVLGGGILFSCFLTCIGILVSMRAETVQSAMQTTSYVMMPVMIIPIGILTFLGASAGPSVFSRLTPLGWTVVVGTVVVVVVGLDLLTMALAVAAFKRHRLMAK